MLKKGENIGTTLIQVLFPKVHHYMTNESAFPVVC